MGLPIDHSNTEMEYIENSSKFLAIHFTEQVLQTSLSKEGREKNRSNTEIPRRTTLLLTISFSHFDQKYPIKTGSFLPCRTGLRNICL